MGSYDAIRVYLWLGLADAATHGRGELLGYLGGMASYMKTHPVPPEKVNSTGNVIGATGPVGFSAALVPFLEAEKMQSEAQAQTVRMAAMKDSGSGLYRSGPNDLRSYDENWAMFSTGWSEERYRFGSDGRLKVKWK